MVYILKIISLHLYTKKFHFTFKYLAFSCLLWTSMWLLSQVFYYKIFDYGFLCISWINHALWDIKRIRSLQPFVMYLCYFLYFLDCSLVFIFQSQKSHSNNFFFFTGDNCPENGRSPGSVSTHHSSPRSDSAYPNSNHTTQSNASPPEGFASQNSQSSDVVIHRKENEGFGFVIISSLNRPESGATIGIKLYWMKLFTWFE